MPLNKETKPNHILHLLVTLPEVVSSTEAMDGIYFLVVMVLSKNNMNGLISFFFDCFFERFTINPYDFEYIVKCLALTFFLSK